VRLRVPRAYERERRGRVLAARILADDRHSAAREARTDENVCVCMCDCAAVVTKGCCVCVRLSCVGRQTETHPRGPVLRVSSDSAVKKTPQESARAKHVLSRANQSEAPTPSCTPTQTNRRGIGRGGCVSKVHLTITTTLLNQISDSMRMHTHEHKSSVGHTPREACSGFTHEALWPSVQSRRTWGGCVRHGPTHKDDVS
jgi:hypothetical protein